MTQDYFVTGGTLRPDAPSYVERKADQVLFRALLGGDFCFILTARQMGKSSLLVRTAARLAERGTRSVFLDLTAVGKNLSVEQWYAGLLLQIGQQLGLEDELLDEWQKRRSLGPLQRLTQIILETVLPSFDGPLVLFIDEIDFVQSLPFSTDEFFAGIRQCHTLRSINPELARLSFCLSGVATPTDLISDKRNTPFNIGTRIDLVDFEVEEGLSFSGGLNIDPAEGKRMVRRILRWTGGHPYLTQQFCRTLAERLSARERPDLDKLCKELFLTPSARSTDSNLVFVRDRILRSGQDITALLEMYDKVRRGKNVPLDKQTPVVETLRLSGIVKVQGNRLRVRNRIYEEVFNTGWAAANLPSDELTRRARAVRKGVLRTVLASSLIVVLISLLALTAFQQRNRAERQVAENRRLAYVKDMQLIWFEWENANIDRVRQLLELQTPSPGEPDLRGFEWRLFKSLSESEQWAVTSTNGFVLVGLEGDGKTLLSAEFVRQMKSSYIIKRYHADTGTLINSFELQAGKNFNVVRLSPDRQLLACDGLDSRNQGLARIVRATDGTPVKVLDGFRDAITAIEFSPDGKKILVSDLKHQSKLFDLGTGAVLWSRANKDFYFQKASFSPDGRRILVVDVEGTLHCLDTRSGGDVPVFPKFDEKFANIVFFPADGNRVLAPLREGPILELDFHRGQITRVLGGSKGATNGFAFSPDGTQIAIGTDRTIRVWDMKSEVPITVIHGHGGEIRSLAWSADGNRLFSAGLDKTLKAWHPTSETEQFLRSNNVRRCFSAGFQDGNNLLAFVQTADKSLLVLNITEKKVLCRIPPPNQGQFTSTAFSPDGTVLATGEENGTISLWTLPSGKPIKEFQGSADHIYALSFSPSGKSLIAGGRDGALRVWDWEQGAPPRELPSDDPNEYRAVFSPDGKKIASAKRNGDILIWDATSIGTLVKLIGHSDRIRALAFSPDGNQLASSSQDNTIRIWDLKTGREKKRSPNSVKADNFWRITYSPKGDRIVTAGLNGEVTIWDSGFLEVLVKLEGHTDEINSLAFSNDGSVFLTASRDGRIKVWNSTK